MISNSKFTMSFMTLNMNLFLHIELTIQYLVYFFHYKYNTIFLSFFTNFSNCHYYLISHLHHGPEKQSLPKNNQGFYTYTHLYILETVFLSVFTELNLASIKLPETFQVCNGIYQTCNKNNTKNNP